MSKKKAENLVVDYYVCCIRSAGVRTIGRQDVWMKDVWTTQAGQKKPRTPASTTGMQVFYRITLGSAAIN